MEVGDERMERVRCGEEQGEGQAEGGIEVQGEGGVNILGIPGG